MAREGRGASGQPLGAITAMVRRDTQVGRPWSSCMSICHTCVVRPMCTGRAVPVTLDELRSAHDRTLPAVLG